MQICEVKLKNKHKRIINFLLQYQMYKLIRILKPKLVEKLKFARLKSFASSRLILNDSKLI